MNCKLNGRTETVIAWQVGSTEVPPLWAKLILRAREKQGDHVAIARDGELVIAKSGDYLIASAKEHVAVVVTEAEFLQHFSIA